MKNINRRQVLKWTPPVLTAITLPVHAQMSICQDAAPAVTAVQSKCAGDPPIGNSVIMISSENSMVDIEILSIEYTGASGSDVISLPSLPKTASADVPLEIPWEGPASDAITCLPVNTIEFTLSYSCSSANVASSYSFNLTEVLSSVVA